MERHVIFINETHHIDDEYISLLPKLKFSLSLNLMMLITFFITKRMFFDISKSIVLSIIVCYETIHFIYKSTPFFFSW